MIPRIDIVVGGQFGSEAKGHVCEILAKRQEYLTWNIRVGGPNAGHTTYDREGNRFPFRHLPVSCVHNDHPLLLGPGSEIDLEVLEAEFQMVEAAGHDSVRHRTWLHAQATILTPGNREYEQHTGMQRRMGSTAKGIGAARADRIMRHAPIVSDVADDVIGMGCSIHHGGFGSRHLDVLIEGTQGYGLGLHAGWYPFCTSGDCRSIDFLAQSGIVPGNRPVHTWVVYRTFPIRVAGNSGPMHDELTWEYLAQTSDGYIEPEITTVTRKTRRIGSWDHRLALDALWANGGPSPYLHPVLAFVDYLDPDLAGCTSLDDLRTSPAYTTICEWEDRLGIQFELLMTGPRTHIWRNQ